MQVKAVIVDDEQPICDEIEYLLKKHLDVKVQGTFNNCFDAITYITEYRPDVIFLDIKMPGISGLEMAKKLSILSNPPLVVFITAFQEYALEAFDTPAIGYIIKPVTEAKLSVVMQKIQHLTTKYQHKPFDPNSKICVIDNGKILPLQKKEVVLAYVNEKDVYIRTADKQYTCTLMFKEIEAILADNNFLRVHRQYIVNLDQVLEIIPWFHGSYLLRMAGANHEDVPVSRSNIKRFKNIMGLK
ncbi:MAG: ypdB [Firmicutes bacterium]|nr:ypdB [Bacillota bacterium]